VPRTNLDRGLQGLQAHIVQLGSRVEVALTETLQALETGNQASLHVCRDIMDLQAQHVALPAPQRDATFVQRITYLLWIAHKLAEIATHVHNICQRIIFIVEG